MVVKKHLLDLLLPCAEDKSLFARASALYVVGQLCEQNIIPFDYLFGVLQIANIGLRDGEYIIKTNAV